MNWEEIKKWLEENKQDANVQSYLKENAIVTADKVKELAQSDREIISWLDSERDKHASKSLETWKTNNLDKLIDEEVKKRNPEQSPEQVQLSKLQQQIADMEREKNRESLKNKALTEATAKKLPSDLVNFVLGEDEQTTMNNIESLKASMDSYVQAQVDERIKSGGYTPPASKSDNKKTNTNDFMTMAKEISLRK